MTPAAVDAMPANDVYMMLYARRADYINKKWKELKRPPSGTVKNDPGSLAAFHQRYGDRG